MYKENYNIHNIISFQIVNNNITGLLNKINPEYEYFKVDTEVDPDFRITVAKVFRNVDEIKSLKYKFKKKSTYWEAEILEHNNSFIELTIVPRLQGIRNLFQFTALKNIYVRSLLYYSLINKGCTLIHSSAVNINGKAYVFVGRPGVFKTSLIMDFLRQTGTSFLGEENVLLMDEKIYPFPLNIQSLSHKIKYYKHEDPPSYIHKLMLGLSLLKNKNINIPISNCCYPEKIFYLEKGNKFDYKKVKLENTIDKLVSNEIQEIDLNPTHSLSGISNNYFSEYLHEFGLMEEIKEKIRNIFLNNFREVDFYSVSMPKSYDTKLINELLRRIF